MVCYEEFTEGADVMTSIRQRIRGQASGAKAGGGHLSLIAVLLIVVGTGIIVAFWSIMTHTERERRNIATRITAEQVRLRLEAWFNDRIALVERLATQHGVDDGISFERLRDDAQELIRLFPGFQALNFVGPDWVIRQVTPRQGNEPALGKDLHDHPDPSVQAALARAERTGRMASTTIVTLLQGGLGFATYQPVRDRQGDLLGFLNGVFRIDRLVNTCLAESTLHDRYRYALADETGRMAYVSSGGGDPGAWPGRSSVPVRIVDRDWRLLLAPTPSGLARGDTWVRNLMSLAGVLLLLALSWTLHRLWQRQRQLHESRARYRLLVDHQADLIVRITPEGRLLFASPSYQRLLGLEEQEVSGHPFVPFVHEDDHQRLLQALQRVAQPPHTVRCEHRVFTEQGLVWLAWSLKGVTDETGRVTSIVGVGRDVTERKELEQRLQVIQRRQLVGQLATGIVQDMDTNLQIMLGHTEFALDLLDPGPAREEIEMLGRDIDRAARLIRRLLNLSREQSPQPRDLDLGRVVGGLERLLRRTLGKEVELVVAVEGYPVVHADPDQCEQIVLNLCLAARRLAAAAGTVSVRVREVELTAASRRERDWARPGRFVELQVHADGLPLDEEFLERLFDPFFTIHRLGEDVGVGLATIYTIIRSQDGVIHVESGQGKGTIFTVLLPAAGGDAGPLDSAPATAVAGETGTVLVAVMEQAVRDHVTRILERAGHEVLVARDGDEVIALVSGQPDRIEAVVLDSRVTPLAERLREIVPDLALVLLVSGREGLPQLQEAAVLDLPFTRAELLQALADLLARRASGQDLPATPVLSP